MTREDIIQMSEGVREPNQEVEAKAAVSCLLLFVLAIVVLGVIAAIIYGIASIFS